MFTTTTTKEHPTAGWYRRSSAANHFYLMHGSGVSHATTATPKPPIGVPWRVGDAVVGRDDAG